RVSRWSCSPIDLRSPHSPMFYLASLLPRTLFYNTALWHSCRSRRISASGVCVYSAEGDAWRFTIIAGRNHYNDPGDPGSRAAEETNHETQRLYPRSEERRVGKECRARWSPWSRQHKRAACDGDETGAAG